MNKWIYR